MSDWHPSMGEPLDEDLEQRIEEEARCSVCSSVIEDAEPFASFLINWPVGPEIQEVCSKECVYFLLDQWKEYLDGLE